MKKQFFILAAFILLNASFALAEWTGDTLKPEYKNGIGYVISKPEELVWVGRYGDTDYRLVNDIIFGKDKNTVNREHPLKSLWLQQGVGLYFNGFSVYGAYSEGEPFIVCSSNYKYPIDKLSLKNFEINVTEKSPSMIKAFNLYQCNVSGNVVAEGVVKVSKERVSDVSIYGGSFVDGVLENRTSVIVDAEKIGSVTVVAVNPVKSHNYDSLSVHEAVNYADISVKADSVGDVKIYGMSELTLHENFYKLSNYGNITVEVKKDLNNIDIKGLADYVTIPKGVRAEVYNGGNISVQINDTTQDTNNAVQKTQVCGLFGRIVDYNDTTSFLKALNRGNINYSVGKTIIEKNYFISGCICEEEKHLKNIENHGNVNVTLGSVSFSDYFAENFYVGGIVGRIYNGRPSVISNTLNLGNINVKALNKEVFKEVLRKKIYVGGVAGYVGFNVANSINLGQISAENVDYLGGIAGLVFDADASKLMNFGSVSGENVPYIGGIMGAYDYSCNMHNGYCIRESHYLRDFANLGNIYALGKSDSVGGIAGGREASNYSYNASKVVRVVKEDSIENVYPNCKYYDWNVYGLSTEPDKTLFYGRALTTAYMQSNKFVDDLNHMKSKDSRSNVWKLSPVYPYPIIADLEDVLKEHQGILSLPPVRQQRALASFDLSVDGMNVLVSGAKVGTPYAVFNLLGHAILRGRLECPNQMIPLSAAGTYIVKVGNATRKVTVKR